MMECGNYNKYQHIETAKIHCKIFLFSVQYFVNIDINKLETVICAMINFYPAYFGSKGSEQKM